MLFANKVLKKKRLIANIYEFEKINDYDKLIRTLIKLEKYSDQNEKGELYLIIADNLKKSYEKNRKSYSIELAVDYLIKALEFSPCDMTKILDSIISCYISIQNYDKAVEYLKKSLLENPMQPERFSHLFDMRISNFSFEDRKGFLNEILIKFPQNAYVHYYQGKENENLHKNKSVHFKKAVELNPNIEYFYHDLINSLESLQEYEETLKYLNLLENNFVNSYLTFEKLGDFYRILSNYLSLDDAKNNYLKAIQMNPSASDVYIKLSETYADLYEFENAIKCLEDALLNTKNLSNYSRGDIMFSLSVLNNLVSNTVVAREYYDNAVIIDNIYSLESYFTEVFDYNIIRMKNILKHNSRNKPVLYSLASRFYNYKNYQQATHYFCLLYYLDPTYKDVKEKSEEAMIKYVDEGLKDVPLNKNYSIYWGNIYDE